MIVNLLFYFIVYPFFINMFLFYVHDSMVKEILEEGYLPKNTCKEIEYSPYYENICVALIPLFNLVPICLATISIFSLSIQLIAIKNKQEKG